MNPKKKDIRIFGLIWTLIFAFWAFYPFIKGAEINLCTAIVSGAFLLISLIAPIILKPFFIVWVKFGEFMGKIISKIILFLLYYLLITPIGLILRIFGKDLLDKKLDKSAKTYWIDRKTQPQSMKNQF